MPGVENRLIESSNEEIAHIAELVRIYPLVDSHTSTNVPPETTSADSEGCFGCKIRRYKEFERSYPRVDHPPRAAFDPATDQELEGGSWVSSRKNWSSVVPCWLGLVKYGVSLTSSFLARPDAPATQH